jgi:hypothetical protein
LGEIIFLQTPRLTYCGVKGGLYFDYGLAERSCDAVKAAITSFGLNDINKRSRFMAVQEIELRVTRLEAEMAQLKKQLEQANPPTKDWLDDIYGAFANDPHFEEAMRLGREYRESLRPKPRKKRAAKIVQKTAKGRP